MELAFLFRCFLYAAIAWVSFQFILTTLKRSKFNPKRVPPGPFPLPIIGNIFSLGTEPLNVFANLSKSYGPVISLHFGWQTIVVVSSASMAKEVLMTHDVSFANRTVPYAFTAEDHHESSIVLRPADTRWKVYRKICISHVFANTRLEATQILRKKKVQDLLLYVQTCSQSGKPVNIGQVAYTTILNILSNTICSIDLGDPNSKIGREFKMLFDDLLHEAATPSLTYALPLLQPLDPQRIKKRSTLLFKKMMTLFDNMISQRLEERKSTADSANRKNDVLDALLSHAQESKEIQLPEVRHLLFDLFMAGTETTSTSLEWAMAELMRNPEKMKKAQIELAEIIGKDNPVGEEDATRLPYLQAVIKETLRMHAPVPFLLPRKVYEDTTLGDFTVPKNALILVNVNAIQKDPNLWENPESFEPERFLESLIDFKGQSFEFLPFGSGRRICPGISMVNKMFPWILGSLIHSFDWKLEDGITSETLNMDVKLGLTLQKAKSLFVIPVVK